MPPSGPVSAVTSTVYLPGGIRTEYPHAPPQPKVNLSSVPEPRWTTFPFAALTSTEALSGDVPFRHSSSFGPAARLRPIPRFPGLRPSGLVVTVIVGDSRNFQVGAFGRSREGIMLLRKVYRHSSAPPRNEIVLETVKDSLLLAEAVCEPVKGIATPRLTELYFSYPKTISHG